MLTRFWQEEEGQTLVEYGLLIGLVSLVEITILGYLGRKLRSGFSLAAAQLSTAS